MLTILLAFYNEAAVRATTQALHEYGKARSGKGDGDLSHHRPSPVAETSQAALIPPPSRLSSLLWLPAVATVNDLQIPPVRPHAFNSFLSSISSPRLYPASHELAWIHLRPSLPIEPLVLHACTLIQSLKKCTGTRHRATGSSCCCCMSLPKDYTNTTPSRRGSTHTT
jgi:hypothetical protein